MARPGENIYKRKDGRWEGRYIKGRRPDGKACFGSVYGYSRNEVRDKLLPLKANDGEQAKMIIASLLLQQGQSELIQDLQTNLDRVRAESEALYDWNKRFQQTSSTLFAENERLQQENAALRTALMSGGYYYQT